MATLADRNPNSKKDPRSLVAFKANQLIDLRDADIVQLDKLTKTQLKIVTYVASKVNATDDIDARYQFTFKEFTEICGLKNKDYQFIKKEAASLASLGMHVAFNKGTTEEVLMIFKWLNEVKIDRGSGIIEYKLDSRLQPMFTGRATSLKYSKIYLHDYMPLKNKYALMLYELLSKWANYGFYRQSIDDLRSYYELASEKIQRINQFVSRCIVEPVEEINKYASFGFRITTNFDYGPRNSVTHVNFRIVKLKTTDAINNTIPESEQRASQIFLCNHFNLSSKIVDELSINYSLEYLKFCLRVVLRIENKKVIKNREGYFYKLVTEHLKYHFRELQEANSAVLNKNENLRQSNTISSVEKVIEKIPDIDETELMNFNTEELTPEMRRIWERVVLKENHTQPSVFDQEQ
ncbi:MAG: replication initiation protein [Bacillota bacterium]